MSKWKMPGGTQFAFWIAVPVMNKLKKIAKEKEISVNKLLQEILSNYVQEGK